MWPDRVSNPGPLALESDALPTAPRGPVLLIVSMVNTVSIIRKHLCPYIEISYSLFLEREGL